MGELISFLSDFSKEIWDMTYRYHKDLTPDDTIRRVAKFVASAEKTEEKKKEWEEKFLDMMSGFKVVPGGRILSNAGTEYGEKGTTLLNCFVVPRPKNPMDSIEGIYEMLKDSALTLKSEGGIGYNFSHLRPRGSFISGIGVESPGAVTFMELFDKSSGIITNGAGNVKKKKEAKKKIRKGAQMGILACWHPDVIEFITAKTVPGRLTKFNISVFCTDEFMDIIMKVEEMKKNGAPEEEIEKIDRWDLVFPDTSFPKYDEEWDGDIEKWKKKGYPVITHKTVKASWLWELITKSTYERNEPGVLFIDRANKYCLSPYAYKIIATNPCGEQALPFAGSCNLGSLNLTQFIDEGKRDFDYEKIAKYAKYLVRFLDNVNDVTKLPHPEYEKFVREKRRIGCGIMGWGSALIMLKIPFNSEKAFELQEKVMKTFSNAVIEASIDLAIEKGPFVGCRPEEYRNNVFLDTIGLSPEYREKIVRYGIRNSSCMSIQPTGNTSIYANIVSGGCEPVFMHRYIRTYIVPEGSIPEGLLPHMPKWWEGQFHETEVFKWDKEGDEDILVGEFEGERYKIDRNRGLTKEELCIDYGVRYLMEKGEWDPNADYAVTTNDLTVEDHIRSLSIFAKYIDSSISKTINLPHDYSYEDFKEVYYKAYKTGFIKGVTTYREGTMTSVLKKVEEKKNNGDMEEIVLDSVKLPDSLPAKLKILRAENRKWYLTVIMNENNTRPVALFVHTNHPEKNVITNDVLERLFALAEKKGIPVRFIEETKEKIKNDNNSTKISRVISLCLRHGILPSSIVNELDKVDVPVTSFLFQIKKFLTNYIHEGERIKGETCPSCLSENSLVYKEGCVSCISCGYSRC